MGSVFDLDGALVLDLSALDDLKSKIQDTAGDGATSNLTVTADTSQATDATKTLAEQVTTLGDRLRTDHVVKVDTTEAKARVADLAAQTASGLGNLTAKVGPTVAVGPLDSTLAELKSAFEGRIPGLFTPIKLTADSSAVDQELAGLQTKFLRTWQSYVTAYNGSGKPAMGDARVQLSALGGLADQLAAKAGQSTKVRLDTTEADKALDGLQSKYSTLSAVIGSKGALVGLGAAAMGAMVAAPLITGAMEAATSDQMMQKSTRQVFGGAGWEYIKQAEDMADATGFLARQTEQAQITINKAAQQVGLGATPVKPLTEVSANLAATSGLPQYANNIQAVSSAVAAGLRGTEGALLDFGINLDAASVLAIPANKAFKALGEAITPAQMAQARYNYIMQETAAIQGAASTTAGDYAASMRIASEKMEGAKAAVGEVLIPIANTIADFVSNVPKPVLEAGVVAGIGLGLAAMVSGVIVAIAAVKKALADLGAQAVVTAAEVKTASAAEGGRGLASAGGGGLGKGVATGGETVAAGGLLGKLTSLLEGAGMAKGGLAAGWGYAGTGTLAAGLTGGMILAAPAVAGAAIANKWASNETKREQSELDAATERYRMNAARVSKLTGASLPAEAAEQGRRQGLNVSGQGGINITLTLNDRTSGGVTATDPYANAPSNY